jgi:predicted RNA polymerase sigma factor
VTREQRGSVELVRSSNECIGDFESTEEAFCCPDFRVTTWAPCSEAPHEDEEIEDDRLRLIFTCCHPALPPAGQVALPLREACSLTTEEIARAFRVTPAMLAQRIVRAKAVIRDKAMPYQVPVSQELPARLGAVLQVVYLVFNEGYSAGTKGAELSREAIRRAGCSSTCFQSPK